MGLFIGAEVGKDGVKQSPGTREGHGGRGRVAEPEVEVTVFGEEFAEPERALDAKVSARGEEDLEVVDGEVQDEFEGQAGLLEAARGDFPAGLFEAAAFAGGADGGDGGGELFEQAENVVGIQNGWGRCARNL